MDERELKGPQMPLNTHFSTVQLQSYWTTMETVGGSMHHKKPEASVIWDHQMMGRCTASSSTFLVMVHGGVSH